MEDGSETNKQLSEPMKNGDVNSIMANFPEGTVTEAKDDKNATESSKVNGGHNQEFEEPNSNLYQDSYSSESDALVIDESVPKKKKVKGKHNKKSKEIVRRTSEKENEHEIFSSSNDTQEKISSDKKATSESIKDFLTNDQSCNRKVQISSDNLDIVTQNSSSDKESSKHFNLHRDNLEPIVNKSHDCDNSRISSELNNTRELLTHSNPYFNESLFELSQLHHANEETTITKSNLTSGREINSTCSRSKRVKPKPKLKEYAQYLGLQPAVQFKCPKCGKSGFESLPLLQDHFLQCNAVQILEKTTENENISGFKLTRKVFLCSACGTYYENWNLYMHMLEYHKRYICLYCLGMFSILDDLCQHIQSRHNLEPGIKNTLEDFYNTYTEPCYVVCCECNRQFNEGDNFFYHNCVPVKAPGKNKAKTIKQIIAPENHITGDSIMVPQETTQTNSEKKDKGVKDNCMNNSECQYENVKGVPCDDQESENNQVDSAKHNLIETETSKQSVSDFSENADESFTSVKERLSVTKEINDINKQMNTDFEEGINKDTCFDNAQDCEQDSLDSNKNSDEGMDNHNSTENTMDAIEDHLSDNNELDEVHEVEEEVETRKVPKLSLKLPKPNDYPDPEDSDDSDKLAMEIDNIESENDNDQEKSDTELPKDKLEETEKDIKVPDIQYPIAGLDIPIIELELDQPLDKMDIKILLQKCLQATAPTCIYCNHSRRIAVNGKQLGLHAIAEHRYSAINKSITAEELIPESFNSRIKECLEQLEQVFFNLDSGASEEAVTFSHVFECFQCHYSTTVHKELYLHNRKFHSKNLLLCIMCKSNFYSYSELICHLCPGVYVLDYDLQFRCCMCVSDDLPSSFRLMVHLRKRHNVCDVCLEMCHSQYKLSNHVWKHKLHHFCYRCGIAYRNKPDITRHLFWKHGTESVLCKKCLQKKWPHVYHFCVPPTSFTCEECSLVFSKAVSLKVHKRIHMDEKKHLCTWEDCSESFISKKLMLKHLKRHTDPPEEQKTDEEIKEDIENKGNEESEAVKNEDEIKGSEEPAKPIKPKVDVYDLPELNLSESDSSDSETEAEKSVTGDSTENKKTDEINAENDDDTKSKDELEQKSLIDIPQEEKPEDIVQPVDDTSSSVMQDIWDNFKNYQASKEKLDSMFTNEIDTKDEPYIPDIPIPVVEEELTWERALRDHDYCAEVEKVPTDTIIEVKPALESTERVDHDYCFQTETDKVESNHSKDVSETTKDVSDQAINKSPARKRTISSSSSSSDSDSSCACGSSCSCSNSSSDSSSSSSDSSNSDSSTEEGIKRQQQRRLKRKERNKTVNKEQETKVDVVTTEQSIVSVEMPINESDLETTESETDEEFYDREPQKFAKKILEEKRAQLLAEMGPNMVPNGSFIESTSRPPTPPAGTVEEEEQPKKKKKTKKRKKKKNEKRDALENRTYSATLIMDSNPPAQISTPSYYQQFHQVERQSPVASITLSLSRNSPAPQTPPLSLSVEPPCLSRQDSTASDTSLRASKRRRVPNKFYGYSSDEEGDKPKRNKIEINKTIPAPVSPMLVPPLTIKTGPSSMAVPPRPPVVEPITLRLPRPTHPPNDFKIQRKPSIPPIRLFPPRVPPSASRDESGTDSNDSDIDEPTQPPMESAKPRQPQLYCYCRCPYDEVSEMIGCDSNDCQIEWFHFECVGIMVPPKGQWFCPDCRKKKQQQRREMLS